MIERKLNIIDEEESIFLFGARQTGKTTFLMERYPKATYIDLLETDLLDRYRKKPSLLREAYQNLPESSLIIIDEIQQVPELLNEVHWLISRKHLRFILCGSSARKLRREGVNTLGGRAIPYYMYPLTSAEIPNFDINRALRNGLLPRHYLKEDATALLRAYVGIYLKEEIQAESLVRNLTNFSRFLEIAALTDGEMVNYQNIATDCGVSANTVKEYFQILEDTLLGHMIPAYTKVKKRRLVQSPRFYLFDVGVTNYLLGRNDLRPGTPEYGHAFEHLIVQEIIAFLGYSHSQTKLSYWRTYTQIEVDVVLGDAEVAIEIKSATEIQNKHLKGLKAFREEHPESRLIIVSQDRISRVSDDIEYLYSLDFLKKLWNGEIA